MATARHDSVDIFPLLLFCLVLITAIFLLRPPSLMFWHYGLGFGDEVAKSSQPPLPPSLPVEAPPVPQNLISGQIAAVPPRAVDAELLDRHIEVLTNNERATDQLAALRDEPLLRLIAVRHSWDMFNNNYMDHISPNGDGPSQRVAQQHRRLFGLIGENVAFYQDLPTESELIAEQFMEMWMNSLGHRRNILSKDWSHFATGCFEGAGTATAGQSRWLCTQLFAQVFANNELDIPERLPPGSAVALRLRPVQSAALPLRAEQIDVASGRPIVAPNGQSNQIDLQDLGGVAVGRLIVGGAADQLTAIQIHVPLGDGRLLIVPGPFVVIE